MKTLPTHKPDLTSFYSLIFLVCTMLASCSKPVTELSQRERELSEPLRENQIIEDGAVRLVLNYADAVINLQSPALSVTQPNVNYYIENMPDNSETTIYTEFTSVSKSGSFDLKVEGFTASTNSKRFYLTGIPMLTTDAGQRKEFLRVQKGVVKYTFTRLY